MLAIYLTVGLSVFAHGLSAAPLADRYARWYERHPRDKAPPMESAPAEVTRARGPRRFSMRFSDPQWLGDLGSRKPEWPSASGCDRFHPTVQAAVNAAAASPAPR